MSFRTVVINKQSKLDYELNYLVVKNDTIVKVLINEITIIIVQNTLSTITTYLLSKLIENKIKIIFCDEKSNPCSELVGYYSNYSNFSRIKKQINWEDDRKNILWKYIIEQKILNSMNLMKINNKDVSIVVNYMQNVEVGDITNREGHCAKVYFNSLFGKDFARGAECSINKYLNYGYSLIASLINREIKIAGYLTELGIHHIGETNPFNLTYDLIEPLRALVDSFVVLNKVNDENYKKVFQNIFSYQVILNKKNIYLDNAIHLYVLNILAFLNNECDKVDFIEYGF